MKSMESNSFLKMLVKFFKKIPMILILSFILFFVTTGFFYKHAHGFPLILVPTQLLVAYYCSNNFQFFKMDFGDGDYFSFGFLFYLGYVCMTLLFFMFFMDLVISVSIYFNPGLIVMDFIQNYLFVYPFLFFYDVLLIIFFYCITKNATKDFSEKKSQGED